MGSQIPDNLSICAFCQNMLSRFRVWLSFHQNIQNNICINQNYHIFLLSLPEVLFSCQNHPAIFSPYSEYP